MRTISCYNSSTRLIVRATAGYCFLPLFGLRRTLRDFTGLHLAKLKVTGYIEDRVNSPCKRAFRKTWGFRWYVLRHALRREPRSAEIGETPSAYSRVYSQDSRLRRNDEVTNGSVSNERAFNGELRIGIIKITSRKPIQRAGGQGEPDFGRLERNV
jgi:hypothetical protein